VVSDPAPSDKARLAVVDRLLASIADRAAIARRLELPGLDRLLASIVEATVELFDAEAASIALLEDDGRLRFRVSAGAQGEGVVGLSVAVGEGIAGHVQQTGQPLALHDVAADPRFERDTAAQTGYIPRSILAVPLELGENVIGVLEVLDKRGAAGFDLDDLSRAGVFARQAAVAIDVLRIDREIGRLLGRSLELLADDTGKSNRASADDLDAIVSTALAGGDARPQPFWVIVDRLARLGAADPGNVELVADLLEVVITRGPGRQSTRGSGASWRNRIAEGLDR
jgi:transcriptional regulator with GAF, ATPase, and Fis domain